MLSHLSFSILFAFFKPRNLVSCVIAYNEDPSPTSQSDIQTYHRTTDSVAFPPEKPKVYQGVRVKITVKELLQQRRAHQAASGGTVSINPSRAPHLAFGLI